MKGKILKENHYVLLFAALWFTINLLFLQSYPFVHTDEPWLSGLTRSIMESGSLSATEDFFDLYPRHPHAIKILYHLLQIPLIALFGYGIFSVRLLSLLAGVLTIPLFFRLLKNVYPESPGGLRFIILLIMSVDIQFLYGTHMARQESLLLLLEITSLVILTEKNLPALRRGMLAGLIIGAATAIHPNAFIIAWPAGLYLLISIIKNYLPRARRKADRSLKEGLLFLVGAAIPALAVVLISFYFNPSFIGDYRAYGEPLGVLDPTDVKWLRLPGYYKKLFLRIGGTYHTPPVYLQMVLFPFFLVADFIRNRSWLNGAGFFGFNIALALIGKYSQPSIIFLLPFYYLAAAGSLGWIFEVYKRKSKGVTARAKRRLFLFPAIVLLSATAFFSFRDITGEKESFATFLKELKKSVPSDGVLLGNLYGEYLTGEEGRFYDWRNLSFLNESELTLENYLDMRSIEYIVLSDELDFIYRNRPVWNVLYGNIAHWYPQMLELVEKKGTLIDGFNSPGYGVRIAPYRYRRDWHVRIYRIDQSDSISE
ncbi:ArnT family glycosyltransferase [Spirochaeta isovalerica]|uniref:4-amino-4-deoxy-L-arabinose transferase-like glycosyltransferase n=1 Tax=Spirochaeta isovalerica TaxID=150 RepID=A0A841R7H2_9SPIO|nr:glycosyltransferase family 39 protein [Spirochaeta isovalerica]MBB6479776.1 4-amino-4-deoxy-L-arabinose transferase-like glycosyltransferase [Spirochaeta isovalerica]